MALAPLLLVSGCVFIPARVELPPGDTAGKVETPLPPERPIQQEPAEVPEPDPPTRVQADDPAAEEVARSQDLWARLRHGFTLESRPEDPRLVRELDRIASNPSAFEHTARRARPFLHYIVEEVEDRGMPLEVALVPAVESEFRPGARSPYWAAGLWQFIPSTGDAFGLRRDEWYDGRCDVTASTRAALDYLEHLAELFDHDWELALAAYNAGPGTVQRAVRANLQAGRPTDFWSLDLPEETSRYLPKLLALAEAVRTPSAFDLELVPLPDEPQFVEIALPHQIELSLAAELATLNTKELKRLNPALRLGVTAPDGPHALLLPPDSARRLKEALARLETEHWVRPRRHRVRQGETLGTIAQGYGVPLEELRRSNDLAHDLIHPGQELRLPSTAREARTRTTKEAPAPPQRKAATYLVRRGDTLWDIAREHGVDHRRLAAWNGMVVEANLKPGTLLRFGPRDQASRRRSISYLIQRGDSLYRIARRFNVSVAELRRWNPDAGTLLHPGQELTLFRDRVDGATL
jgi:membrane-bound lytic murein transglycosylase D